MGYSADKSSLIGHFAGPTRRLEPLGAQRQEKGGPNHLTREGLHATTPMIASMPVHFVLAEHSQMDQGTQTSGCWNCDRFLSSSLIAHFASGSETWGFNAVICVALSDTDAPRSPSSVT